MCMYKKALVFFMKFLGKMVLLYYTIILLICYYYA